MDQPEAEEDEDDGLQCPESASGEGIAGALAQDDAQIQGALHNHGVGQRERKKGEQDSDGEEGPGRRLLHDRFG